MPSLVVIRLEIKVKQRGYNVPPQPIWFQKAPARIGLRLHTRFHALFNDMAHIYLCECNSKIFMKKLILVIHGYDKHISKVDLHLQGL